MIINKFTETLSRIKILFEKKSVLLLLDTFFLLGAPVGFVVGLLPGFGVGTEGLRYFFVS
jgi:hypothetical protein